MIVTKTPLRISFIGGGTDLPDFYKKHYGAVVSTTINKYVYVTVKKHNNVFDEKIRLNYFETEIANHTSEIKNNIIRETLYYLNEQSPLYISTIADFPSKSGLGSSSCFTVGLLKALYAFRNKRVSVAQLAEEAFKIETEKVKSPIGKQDQYAGAIGGMNYFLFRPDDKVTIEPLTLQKAKLEYFFDNLMLFWTGLNRDANEVLTEQKTNTKSKFEFLKKMTDNAERFKTLLHTDFRIENVGEMLHENWQLKKQLASKISNSFIDGCYEKALKNGALGGKICGAGNGGCLLLVVKKENQARVKDILKDLKEVKIEHEPCGTRSIL